MAYWLLKTEPTDYSWDDLVRDGGTVWDGVANNTALIHLRAMKPGDSAIIYHTGDERAAVGLAEITSAPYPDPKEDNPKLVVVDLKPTKKLAEPVTLAEIKAAPQFAGWDFLRIGRLSVVPVPVKMWKHLLKLAGMK
jgi:predicted RNA-binding protein with PUA-like domain